MKILHTSDWHLNDRLGRIERQGDIRNRLEEIATYLDEYQVDVMLVAGDLLSQYNRIEEIRKAIGDMSEIFKPFLLRGGTILIISGNHDKEDCFRLLRFATDLASPIDLSISGARPNGRLYFVTDPTSLLLEDKKGQPVQFALMPYPTPKRYLKSNHLNYGSKDEKNLLLHNQMMETFKKLQQCLNPKIPSVLVSHAHIRGSQIHNLYKITEQEDIIFNPNEIPTNWAYGAFGHIHKPQALAGTKHIRYSGSIERLDKGEKNDDKSVVLFEVGSQGMIDEPVLLPLNATPIYTIEITDPSVQIPLLKAQYPDAERALVYYKLIYQPSEHNRDAMTKEIERIFPRWYNRDIIAEGSDISLTPSHLTNDIENVSEVVKNYLQEQLKTDKDAQAILSLAKELLAIDD